jgi:uncharacterized membrane protein
VTWLVFLPNAPYIFTDLVHLSHRTGISVWFDLVLTLLFAWPGLLLGLISIARVHVYLEANFTQKMSNAIVAFIILACSFGIFLGRTLRWNTWDIVMQPMALLKDIGSLLVHPFRNLATLGVTLSFSVFLGVSYCTVWIVTKAFKNEKTGS